MKKDDLMPVARAIMGQFGVSESYAYSLARYAMDEVREAIIRAKEYCKEEGNLNYEDDVTGIKGIDDCN